MDDKLFMVWFVVSFAFRNQTRTEQELPLFGVLDWVARLLWSKERVIKDLCRSFLGSRGVLSSTFPSFIYMAKVFVSDARHAWVPAVVLSKSETEVI